MVYQLWAKPFENLRLLIKIFKTNQNNFTGAHCCGMSIVREEDQVLKAWW